jgi:hypothetical protein
MDPMVAWETKEEKEYLAYSIYVSTVTTLPASLYSHERPGQGI